MGWLYYDSTMKYNFFYAYKMKTCLFEVWVEIGYPISLPYILGLICMFEKCQNALVSLM